MIYYQFYFDINVPISSPVVENNLGSWFGKFTTVGQSELFNSYQELSLSFLNCVYVSVLTELDSFYFLLILSYFNF